MGSCTLITRYIEHLIQLIFFSDKKIIKINHGILETRPLRMFQQHQPLPLHLLLSMLRHRCNRRKNRLRGRLFHGRLQNLYPSLRHWYLKKQREAVQDKEGIEQGPAWKEWAIVCCLGLCSVSQQAKQMDVDPWGFKMMGEDIERN